MKNSLLKTCFLVFLFLSCYHLNSAIPVTGMVYKSSEPMKFILQTSELKSPEVNCSIRTSEGKLVYSDKIKTEKVPVRLFDMSQLAQGDYNFELEDDLKIIHYNISVKENTLHIDEVVEYSYKPVFKSISKGVIGLTMLSLDRQIKVELLDEEEILYSEEIKSGKAIAKSFDLKQLQRGDYLFRVTTDGHTFYHSVRI